MDNARWKYYKELWKPRALRRAMSLVGKQYTEREQEVIEANRKGLMPWEEDLATFMAFGIRPEMQKYIDKTIEMLEDPDSESKGWYWAVCAARLEMSCEELLKGDSDGTKGL